MKKHLLSSLLLVFALSFCQAQKPIFLGMTYLGGTTDSGTIFSYSDSLGAETDIRNFGDSTSGTHPYGSFIKVNDSLYFGMTSDGGANNLGTIFSYNDSSGQFTDLYDFGYSFDGQNPFGSLLQVNDSLLYGLTAYGGTNDFGTIFSYNILAGVETSLFNFGSGADGEYPYGSLIKAKNGLLYGMLELGGTDDGGAIFSYNIFTNTENDVYDFSIYHNDGYNPNGSLLQATDGLLYGMTVVGGDSTTQGAIFNYNISTGTETVLYSFADGPTDGSTPYGSLFQANDGLLYGMTQIGGAYTRGTIFSYNISTGIEKDIHDFGNGTDGQYPYNSFIQASDGLLYATTEMGGAHNKGTIFSFNTSTNTEDNIFDFNGVSGSFPLGNLIEADSAAIGSGINEIVARSNNISLHPNPSLGQITVSLSDNIDDIKIYDLFGQVIYSASPKQNELTINIEKSGLYCVTLISGNNIATGKLIITK